MTDRSTDAFAGHRELLRAVAYRVLGSMADAEDVVQDAWLRWRDVDAATIEDPRGFLVTVTTRLAIDRLRRLRARREVYVGPWLPELVATEPDLPVELADSVSMALLVVFETLSPLERAVFVLHEVFGFSYPEVGRIVGKTDAAVRQLGHRARNNVQARRPRYATDRVARRAATERFLRACLGGDLVELMAVLAPDVTLHSDTGGLTPGPRRVVFGADRVARLFAGAVDRVPAGTTIEYLDVNGSPAAAALAGGVCYAVFVIDVDADSGLVGAVYLVSNPDKLARVGFPPITGGGPTERRIEFTRHD
jgi:RNA polymerase sigma factor (sigma-70 family)